MTTTRSIFVLLCGAALGGCSGDGVRKITEAPVGGTYIKFHNFAVGAPSVNFYANDTKMTAISSGSCTPTPSDTVLARQCVTAGIEAAAGVTYGGLAAGGFYTDIAPGSYTIRGKISSAASTDPNLVIATLATNLAAGKRYSFYQSGIYDATAKTADAFIIEDPLTDSFDYTKAYVRFVNAIGNSSPMTLFVKDSTGTETAVGAAVAYKTAGSFTAVRAGTYDLAVRVNGGNGDAISKTGFVFGLGRVYTVTARGDMTVGSTTDAKRPMLDVTANR